MGHISIATQQEPLTTALRRDERFRLQGEKNLCPNVKDLKTVAERTSDCFARMHPFYPFHPSSSCLLLLRITCVRGLHAGFGYDCQCSRSKNSLRYCSGRDP